MGVIIGHYWEDKNIPFGGKKLSYRVETFITGWWPLALQHLFHFFFWKFWKFWILWSFVEKNDFLKFLGQKSKI